MKLSRREFGIFVTGFVSSGLCTSTLAQSSPGASPLWINVQANGGIDAALFCDPKPNLRPALATKTFAIYGQSYTSSSGAVMTNPVVGGQSALQVHSTPGDGIRYLSLCDFYEQQDASGSYKSFFKTFYDRVTVFNGVDFSTNNHAVGERYGASGSSNELFPCMSAQIARGVGQGMPLPFITFGAMDETGGLVSSTPLNDKIMRSLLSITNPNDRSGDNLGGDRFIDDIALDRMHSHLLSRLEARKIKSNLPPLQAAYSEYLSSLKSKENFSKLVFSTRSSDEKSMLKVVFNAYRLGLTTSLNIMKSGFDAHGDAEADTAVGGRYGGSGGLFGLLESLKFIIQESENPSDGSAPIPVVIVLSTDFGRSPFYAAGGTDHWPIGSMMIIQNTSAKAMSLGLPTNTTIGATRDGAPDTAMRALKINPNSYRLDDRGIYLTPGHIVDCVRRMAGITEVDALSAYPLAISDHIYLG